MTRDRRRKAAAALLGLVLALPAAAQEGEAAVPAETLVVGTKEAPPFAMKDADGTWSGISIELWRDVARRLGVDYRLEERSLEGLLDGLADGSLDAAAAALTMTAEREREMDFSHPFYTAGLGIATARAGSGLASPASWARGFRSLLSPELWIPLLVLLGVLFLFGLLAWLFERKRNEEQFGAGLRGLGNGFWWSAVTMTTVGYGDKAPVTLGGRLVGLVWMFISVVILSSLTAAIASALTVANLGSAVSGPQDLPRVAVGSVPGSTSARYLDQRDVHRRDYPDLGAALDALEAGEVDAVVYDAPLLKYRLQERGNKRLEVLPETFEHQRYAIGLPQGSPLREPVNRLVLQEIRGQDWDRLVRRYLGQ